MMTANETETERREESDRKRERWTKDKKDEVEERTQRTTESFKF